MKLLMLSLTLMFSLSIQAKDCADCTIAELDEVMKPIQEQVKAWEETMTRINKIRPDFVSNVDKFNQKTDKLAERMKAAKTQDELDLAYADYDEVVKNFCEEDYMDAVESYDLEFSKIRTITEAIDELVNDNVNLFDIRNRYNELGRYEQGRHAMNLYSYTGNILMGAGYYETLAKINKVHNYVKMHEGYKQEIISASYDFCKDILFKNNN